MELSSPCFTTYSAAGASTTGAQGNVLLVNAAFSSSLATTNAICAFVASNDSNDDTQAIMASSVNELKATNTHEKNKQTMNLAVMDSRLSKTVKSINNTTQIYFTLKVYCFSFIIIFPNVIKCQVAANLDILTRSIMLHAARRRSKPVFLVFETTKMFFGCFFA